MDFIIPPWDHQKQAIAKSLVNRDYALLWNMGTGKSGATVNIIRAKCASYGRQMKVLILAPPIVLLNWKREFAMHSKIPPTTIEVLSGTGSKRIQTLQRAVYDESLNQYNKPKIIIVNYEALLNKELFETLMSWSPEILVCDESHKLKDPTSKRAKLVTKIADKAWHRYILTGTPILNSAMDIFSQYRILDGGETFGHNFGVFKRMYFEDANAAWSTKPGYFPKLVPRPSTYAELNQRIYMKAMRVDKETCISLPEFVRVTRDVEMSPEQNKMYNQMRDDYITYVKNESTKNIPRAVVAQMALTKALRLQQIVSGFAKDEHEAIHKLKDVPRLKILTELLEEIAPHHKVIVWSCFKTNYDQIKDVCNELELPFAEIHGAISTKDKEKMVDTFRKDPACRVMIANQQSGGVGINLTEASYSIFYSRDFSLEHDLQAESRNYRGGSDIHEKVTRIDLISPGTIDELISEALRMKQNISDLILDWKI